MDDFAADENGFFRNTSLIRAGRNDRALRRAVEKGELVSLLPGVFVPSVKWKRLDERGRHVTRASAVAERLPPTAVFSHATAAAVLGYQWLGRWPDLVEVTDAEAARTRRGATSRTHAFPLSGSDIESVNGLPVTTAGRTSVDLAVTIPFRNSIVTLDSALESAVRPRRLARPLTLEAFDAALERRLPVRCHKQVARVRAFANGLSDSGGESLSRVVLHERGWPCPVLQQEFFDAAGKIGEVDFWWPEFGVIGEFDGFVKYSRGSMSNGLAPADVVVKEKRREDRLRAHAKVRGFARWMFDDLSKPGRLDSVLAAAGLRR